MHRDEIIDTVRNFITETFLFGNDSDGIRNEDSFIETGIIDSTGILELIEFLEENYKIHIEDDELIPENLDSLEHIARYILSKLGV